MSLESIVNVQISRETSSVSRAGFGVPLILGTSKAFTSLLKFYSSYNAVLEDFISTDKEAIAASAIFSQNPVVEQIAIGRRETGDNVVVTVVTVENSTQYSCTINGTVFSVTSDATATAIEIAGLLVAAINGGSEPVTATDNGDGTYDLDADVAGTPFSLKLDSRQSAVFTTPNTVGDDLTNIDMENPDWYGLILVSRVQADVEAAAAWTETQKKIFITASADSDIADTTDAADTTTIAAVVKAAAYARTAVFYHASAASQFLDAGLLGRILPQSPGSYTAAYKTIAGITVDNLTDTQIANILAKNANLYISVASVNITRNGTVGEGEYIDIIIGVDWLQARLTERLYGLLVNNLKLPYTDEGITAIDAEIRAQLDEGIDAGFITNDPAYIVTVPNAADVSAQDKANRELNNVTFAATLAGAIHKITVNGTVSL
jgi:hypothetical protein